MLAASSSRGLAYVELPHASGHGFGGFQRRIGAQATRGWSPNRVAIEQIREYLAGKRREFDLHLDIRGTEFQRAVWDELCRIPFGVTYSYQDVARAIGRPSAVRAVGTANGANPLPLVVPCHRVVATGGKLGGYGGGLELKRRLLVMERAEPGAGALL